ncbi:MAG: NAD(P)H-hydrate dehydratase [Chloroflexi bacterium]|nr:NAD(P)H-hydrate dehydratase [Chloroflexota bacterium]
MKVVTVEQMRQIDRQCAELGLPTNVLMENAGRAVAEEVRRILVDVGKRHILVLAGHGNNGGDGLVAAWYLHHWGAMVSIYLCGRRPPDDPHLERVKERNIAIIEDENLDKLRELLASVNVAIDAIFGTGQSRPLQGAPKRALETVTTTKEKRPDLKIIALDLPSGLNADTGAIDPACLYADYTITLGFPKLGLFNSPGAGRIGQLSIVDIGIPAQLAEGIDIEIITPEWVWKVLPRRLPDANKGSLGRILVCGGSINYIGASYLACNGSMLVGAGLVTLALAKSLQPVLASKLTEPTYLPLPEATAGIIAPKAIEVLVQHLDSYNVLLLGCGLGQSQSVTEFVGSLLFETKLPRSVLDADALNILSKTPRWWQKLTDDAILTPHPGEMSRLTGIPVEEIQSNRLEVTQKAAKEWHKTVVLKGAYTVIASPDGRAMISPFANPGLASAGTGDVLAGAIAGLLGQGLSLFDAAVTAVHIHGKAGEAVRQELGDAGMVASDLLPALPKVIKQLKVN